MPDDPEQDDGADDRGRTSCQSGRRRGLALARVGVGEDAAQPGQVLGVALLQVDARRGTVIAPSTIEAPNTWARSIAGMAPASP